MPELVIRHDPPRAFLCLAGVIYRQDIAKRIGALVARFSELATSVPHLGSQVALYHPQGRDPFGPDGEPVWLGRELLASLDAPRDLQVNWTPGGDVAVLVHEGAYEHMLATTWPCIRQLRSAGASSSDRIGSGMSRRVASRPISAPRSATCWKLYTDPWRRSVGSVTDPRDR